jgi:hypothetical protein
MSDSAPVDELVTSAEFWSMPYTVWRRPDGSRYIKVDSNDVARQMPLGVKLEEIIELGTAKAADVLQSRFRGSVWD